MRLSTVQMHQRSLQEMLAKQKEMSNLQLKISSGKRMLEPADDPGASSHLVTLRTKMSQHQQFLDNIHLAQHHLNEEETIVGSMVDVFSRVRELFIYGSSDALGSKERQSIAHEIQQCCDQLADLANTKDASGHYIFAGFKGGIKPFSKEPNGQWQYFGDEGKRYVQVSPTTQVAINDSGHELIENIKNGNGTFTVDFNATNSGTGVINTGEVTDATLLIPDTYTIKFMTNQAGKLVYNVHDSAANRLIPDPSQDPRSDAPLYQSGQAIAFNGIKTVITGTPQAGDSFTVSPSVSQSLLTTVNNAVTALGSSDVPRHNLINQNLTDIEQALDNLATIRSTIGSRMHTLDTQTHVNENAKLITQKALSNIEDLDITQAISQLAEQSATLKAAEQSYLKLQSLSIFNYL